VQWWQKRQIEVCGVWAVLQMSLYFNARSCKVLRAHCCSLDSLISQAEPGRPSHSQSPAAVTLKLLEAFIREEFFVDFGSKGSEFHPHPPSPHRLEVQSQLKTRHQHKEEGPWVPRAKGRGQSRPKYPSQKVSKSSQTTGQKGVTSLPPLKSLATYAIAPGLAW